MVGFVRSTSPGTAHSANRPVRNNTATRRMHRRTATGRREGTCEGRTVTDCIKGYGLLPPRITLISIGLIEIFSVTRVISSATLDSCRTDSAVADPNVSL